ncbi:ClpP family protease [Campylobacter sputorum]|uniref:ClpP family protease n=1 Tax=Campylobacter sputorum TaxID=206 RepID=UPI001F16E8BE|nr:ATP-dependent Clp protease proteolytic subunit [Campylobacter sputorum]
MNGLDAKSEINIYISGPGGSIYDGLGLIDVMRTIAAPINTICVGLSASMSAMIFLNGDRRYMMPNSRLMLHQPLGGVQGQASEIELVAKQIITMKEQMNAMIANCSKISLQKVAQLTDRDCYIEADAALTQGLCDKILTSPKQHKLNKFKKFNNKIKG